MIGKDDAPPFQLGTLEIQEEPNRELRDMKIVDHAAAFVVGDALDRLRVDDDIVICYQVRHGLAHLMFLVQQGKSGLLDERDVTEFELDTQGIS